MTSFNFVICDNCKQETYQGFVFCTYCEHDVSKQMLTNNSSTDAAGLPEKERSYRIVKSKSLIMPFIVLGLIGVAIAGWLSSNSLTMPDSSTLYYLKAFLLGGIIGALLFG